MLIFSNEVDCRYCYKCLRNCYVKSISFERGTSEVIEEECIVCGKCIDICPQGARVYRKDLNEMDRFIGKPFLVSIAPSFFAHFDEPFKVIGALKKLGAVAVQETAVGADIVSKDYVEYFEKNKKTIISTACPVVVNLAEEYYPEVLEYLAPFDSPMIAHAKFMKFFFGDFPVVFIGPCIAKKTEVGEYVDLVLTFEEVEEYLQKFDLDVSESYPTPPYPSNGRLYPFSGGINLTMNGSWINHIVVEGIENVAKIFEKIDTMKTPFFVEASACSGGCIEGPLMRKDTGLMEKRERIILNHQKLSQTDASKINVENLNLNTKRKFIDRSKRIDVPEEKIQEVLKLMGKDDPSKELNCSACGYNTCREKAIAVVLKKAEPEMCLMYLIEKIKSTANLVVEESPNAVFIFNEGEITYKNRAAERLFFKFGEQTVMEILNSKITGDYLELDNQNDYSAFFVKSFELPENGGNVIMLIDITKEKMQEKKISEIKKQAFESIEEMLTRQMKTTQEIAGMLGESIAETKSQFLNLKKILEEKDARL